MAGKGFEQLRVYRLSESLADGVWDMVQKWGVLARDTIGKQMIRSSDGIGANIAEGYGRGSYQDNRRFIRMARGSLYETRHWLRRAYQRKLLTEAQTIALKPIVGQLARRRKRGTLCGEVSLACASG